MYSYFRHNLFRINKYGFKSHIKLLKDRRLHSNDAFNEYHSFDITLDEVTQINSHSPTLPYLVYIKLDDNKTLAGIKLVPSNF